MRAVYLKELRSYFTSTLGYIYIAMMLAIFGLNFFQYNLYYGLIDYSYVLSNVTTLILLAMPVGVAAMLAAKFLALPGDAVYYGLALELLAISAGTISSSVKNY